MAAAVFPNGEHVDQNYYIHLFKICFHANSYQHSMYVLANYQGFHSKMGPLNQGPPTPPLLLLINIYNTPIHMQR